MRFYNRRTGRTTEGSWVTDNNCPMEPWVVPSAIAHTVLMLGLSVVGAFYSWSKLTKSGAPAVPPVAPTPQGSSTTEPDTKTQPPTKWILGTFIFAAVAYFAVLVILAHAEDTLKEDEEGYNEQARDGALVSMVFGILVSFAFAVLACVVAYVLMTSESGIVDYGGMFGIVIGIVVLAGLAGLIAAYPAWVIYAWGPFLGLSRPKECEASSTPASEGTNLPEQDALAFQADGPSGDDGDSDHVYVSLSEEPGTLPGTP
jgi:uncharacterized membrane protein